MTPNTHMVAASMERALIHTYTDADAVAAVVAVVRATTAAQ